MEEAQQVSVPQCSVLEILHALAHGDKTVRALAGRALRSIIFGEVDVLEDLLDDVMQALRPLRKKREDGRTLLDIAVEDASNGDADAVSLLLAITELDERWMSTRRSGICWCSARGEVQKAAHGKLRRPKRFWEGGARLGVPCSQSLEAPAAKIATPNGFRAEDDTLVPAALLQHARALRRLRRRVLGAAVRGVPQRT